MSVKEVERHAVVRSMIGLKYGDGEPIDNLLIAEVREGCARGESAEGQRVGTPVHRHRRKALQGQGRHLLQLLSSGRLTRAVL